MFWYIIPVQYYVSNLALLDRDYIPTALHCIHTIMY